jgi:hypothetical protein
MADSDHTRSSPAELTEVSADRHDGYTESPPRQNSPGVDDSSVNGEDDSEAETIRDEDDEKASNDLHRTGSSNNNTFVSPDLAQHIPENVEQQVKYQLSLYESDVRYTKKYIALALATVEWYYLCGASQQFIAQGLWRRPVLEESDRSMTWLGNELHEMFPNRLDHFKFPELKTRDEKKKQTDGPIDHFSFSGQPVTSEARTPSSISMWHAISPAIGSKSYRDIPLRQRVISAEAGKLLEPFDLDGEYINSLTPDVNLPIPSYYIPSTDGDIVINDDGRSLPARPSRNETGQYTISPLRQVEVCENEPCQSSVLEDDSGEENAAIAVFLLRYLGDESGEDDATDGEFIIRRAEALSRSRASYWEF